MGRRVLGRGRSGTEWPLANAVIAGQFRRLEQTARSKERAVLRSRRQAAVGQFVLLSGGPRTTRASVVVAVVATLVAAGWMALNVAGNYDRAWTALFYTGADVAVPEAIDDGHTYRVPDPGGYDAQYYHLIAHDPLIRRGFETFVDNPRMRWRRIGVPGLAALLALGSDRFVDYFYIAIQLGFVFLGVWWLARFAEAFGRDATWGLAFLLIPAVMVSLERMTVDLPLATLCIGFALYGSALRRLDGTFYAILMAAPLVRETGGLLIGGWCLYSLLRRDWRAVFLGASCAVPTLAWWLYVHSRLTVDGTEWIARYPFSGLIDRMVLGINAPLTTQWLRNAATLEQVAIVGIWLGLLLACYLAWTRSAELIGLTTVLFVVFSSMLGKLDIWTSAYATGRTMSPWLLLMGLLFLRGRGWVYGVPLLLVLPRIAMQYEVLIKSAIGGLR